MRGTVALDQASDADLRDVSAGVEAIDLSSGPGAPPVPNVAMDVDEAGTEAPPPDYLEVDLTGAPPPYAGDPMAPVGEYGLGQDPARCSCRCSGEITLGGAIEPVACEA
eukprot:984463-Alexandrium_andersonii.AAC.1